jgi:hypothetical protein
MAPAIKDGPAATPSLRTLGGGAQQAAAGDHVHAGAMVLIHDEVLTVAKPSVDIPNIPATYRHLLLLVYGRGTLNATNTGLLVRLNDDTTANYSRQVILAAGSATLMAEGMTGATALEVGDIPAASAPAGSFGAVELKLLHYATTAGHKPGLSHAFRRAGTTANDLPLTLRGHIWLSTAAITRVTVSPGSGDLAVGTAVSLYGLNG